MEYNGLFVDLGERLAESIRMQASKVSCTHGYGPHRPRHFLIIPVSFWPWKIPLLNVLDAFFRCALVARMTSLLDLMLCLPERVEFWFGNILSHTHD